VNVNQARGVTRQRGASCWCERGNSNPHGFPRQILSSCRTKSQQHGVRLSSIYAGFSLLPSMYTPVLAKRVGDRSAVKAAPLRRCKDAPALAVVGRVVIDGRH